MDNKYTYNLNKEYYESIFIYENQYNHILLYEVDIDVDIKSNKKELKLVTSDSYDLTHNFMDIIMVIIHLYDKTGYVHRRDVFEVNLLKYNQKYELNKSLDKSYINLIFEILNYHIIDNESVQAEPFESWIQRWFRDKKIDRLIN